MENYTFDFEHINLIPKKCIVDSRSECNTSIRVGNFTFKNPVIPANMECVINEEIAETLSRIYTEYEEKGTLYKYFYWRERRCI